MWIEQAHQIDHYISQGGESCIYNTGILLFMGERQVLPVYKIPVDFISFNVVNGRFASEKKELENELGFELDPMNSEHEKYFLDLLLPKGASTEDLIKDIEKNGQLYPGVITYDGFLVDANRRLAAMKTLNKLHPGSRYQYLLVHRLPASVPDVEIYKLEVQFQIKSDLKEKYNPINNLLKIKEGLSLMEPRELAETLDWSIKEIENYSKRLDLVDGFLDFVGDPGNYTKVINLNEHFVEFQKEWRIMSSAGVSSLKMAEALDAFYFALKVNLDPNFNRMITHGNHIRHIREAFNNDKIYKVLTNNMFNNPNATTEQIFNDVNAAAELIKMQRANDKPIEHLKKAINFLSQISEDNNAIQSTEFRDAFGDLELIVKQLKQYVEE